MKIILSDRVIETEKELVCLLFKNDDELSNFISLLVKTPVKSTGVRLLTLAPTENLTPLQNAILNVLSELDGFGGKNHETICENAINSLKDIIEK